MEDTRLHEIQISENLLKHINELTKMSIKVYRCKTTNGANKVNRYHVY